MAPQSTARKTPIRDNQCAFQRTGIVPLCNSRTRSGEPWRWGRVCYAVNINDGTACRHMRVFSNLTERKYRRKACISSFEPSYPFCLRLLLEDFGQLRPKRRPALTVMLRIPERGVHSELFT